MLNKNKVEKCERHIFIDIFLAMFAIILFVPLTFFNMFMYFLEKMSGYNFWEL